MTDHRLLTYTHTDILRSGSPYYRVCKCNSAVRICNHYLYAKARRGRTDVLAQSICVSPKYKNMIKFRGGQILMAIRVLLWIRDQCRPDLQDPTYINSCIPQLPHQTSGIYTRHLRSSTIRLLHRPTIPELTSPTALSDALLLPSGTL